MKGEAMNIGPVVGRSMGEFMRNLESALKPFENVNASFEAKISSMENGQFSAIISVLRIDEIHQPDTIEQIGHALTAHIR
jgi:hypothetical protein